MGSVPLAPDTEWYRGKEVVIPGMVVHTYDPSSQEAEAGGSQQVQD